MARGVRQSCPASFFLFAMAFDPIFRWLQDAIIPRNSPNLEFIQPVSCACADDFAVAASSIRCLMTALAPAFQIMDQIVGLNLNHRKCCWVQYDSESCQSLLDRVATNCDEFCWNEAPVLCPTPLFDSCCLQSCHTHLIILPSHTRWLKCLVKETSRL